MVTDDLRLPKQSSYKSRELSITGQTCVSEAVYAVSQASPGICSCSLVPMAGKWQKHIGKDSTYRHIDDLWPKGHYLWWKAEGAGHHNLEERRHQSDMVQTFNILHGYDRVNCVCESWPDQLDNKKCYRSTELETAGSTAGSEEEFLLHQSGGEAE